MLGRPLGEIRFDANDLEQARALGAAHGEGWQSIIVGDDVADQLAADHLARAAQGAAAPRARRARRRREPRPPDTAPPPRRRGRSDAA